MLIIQLKNHGASLVRYHKRPAGSKRKKCITRRLSGTPGADVLPLPPPPPPSPYPPKPALGPREPWPPRLPPEKNSPSLISDHIRSLGRKSPSSQTPPPNKSINRPKKTNPTIYHQTPTKQTPLHNKKKRPPNTNNYSILFFPSSNLSILKTLPLLPPLSWPCCCRAPIQRPTTTSFFAAASDLL